LVDSPFPPPTGLALDAAGRWFHDAQWVRHARLSRLLDESVARDASGALIVTTGRDVMPFVCEDTPLFVVTVEGPDQGPRLLLSDGRSLGLDEVRRFTIDGEGRMRLRVSLGTSAAWALAKRPAAQWLAARIETATDGDIVLDAGGGRIAVEVIDASPPFAD